MGGGHARGEVRRRVRERARVSRDLGRGRARKAARRAGKQCQKRDGGGATCRNDVDAWSVERGARKLRCDANENLHAEERPAPFAYIFVARLLDSAATVVSRASPSYCFPLERKGTGSGEARRCVVATWQVEILDELGREEGHHRRPPGAQLGTHPRKLERALAEMSMLLCCATSEPGK